MAVLSAPLSTREGVGVSLYVNDIKNIGEDTCSGDTCASTVALNHERVGVIAFGVEYDDVVAALEFGKGSVEPHFFKAHRAPDGVQTLAGASWFKRFKSSFGAVLALQ